MFGTYGLPILDHVGTVLQQVNRSESRASSESRSREMKLCEEKESVEGL